MNSILYEIGKIWNDLRKAKDHQQPLRTRRFVLVPVGYLSSSEAYTNNWDLVGKKHYLGFDGWKHFLKILRRSEITINLTRPLKKMQASSSPSSSVSAELMIEYNHTVLGSVVELVLSTNTVLNLFNHMIKSNHIISFLLNS